MPVLLCVAIVVGGSCGDEDATSSDQGAGSSNAVSQVDTSQPENDPPVPTCHDFNTPPGAEGLYRLLGGVTLDYEPAPDVASLEAQADAVVLGRIEAATAGPEDPLDFVVFDVVVEEVLAGSVEPDEANTISVAVPRSPAACIDQFHDALSEEEVDTLVFLEKQPPEFGEPDPPTTTDPSVSSPMYVPFAQGLFLTPAGVMRSDVPMTDVIIVHEEWNLFPESWHQYQTLGQLITDIRG